VAQCDVKNATVRQLQSAAGAEFGKPQRFVLVGWRVRDAGGPKVVSDPADQNLSESNRVNQYPPRLARQQNLGSRSMIRICGIQMRNKDACIHGDHPGQSALKSTR